VDLAAGEIYRTMPYVVKNYRVLQHMQTPVDAASPYRQDFSDMTDTRSYATHYQAVLSTYCFSSVGLQSANYHLDLW
jgi:hypothetical protein